jgi:NADH dehydrogenase/NADH:ubiquinone oxidoreductase subunit G
LSEIVNIIINNVSFQVEKGITILQAARKLGIKIPTLCDNEAIEPYGACRLCIVELEKGSRNRIVTSCLYPVEEGLIIKTDTERVIRNRKMLLSLLLTRCSENRVIKDLAAEYSIERPPFREKYWEKNDCIVCGLCVRACEQIVGVSAISLVNRGISKEPAPPFLEKAKACIGCGSCYYVCPTNAIKMEDRNGIRRIYNWKVEFKLKRCSKCGIPWAPEAQLNYIIKKWDLPDNIFDLCPNCR